MVRLASRQKSPINGFQFFESTTGRRFNGWSFDAMVSEIQKHRLANPRFGLSTNREDIGHELDYQNALRMQQIPNADSYITSDDMPPPNPQVPPSQSHWQPSVAGASRLVAGAQTLSDWWLDGAQPIPEHEANERAAICFKCPKNERGDLSNYFTRSASEMILKAVERRNSMHLRTDFDERLGVCSACECPLKLKVHVPKPTILKHMDQAVIQKLDPICWITK
jgi:hypothetical protein